MSVKAPIEVRINMRRIVSILIVVGCVSRAESETVLLWGRFETQVENTKSYLNSFKDVELNAILISPSGKSIDFFGFYVS